MMKWPQNSPPFSSHPDSSFITRPCAHIYGQLNTDLQALNPSHTSIQSLVMFGSKDMRMCSIVCPYENTLKTTSKCHANRLWAFGQGLPQSWVCGLWSIRRPKKSLGRHISLPQWISNPLGKTQLEYGRQFLLTGPMCLGWGLWLPEFHKCSCSISFRVGVLGVYSPSQKQKIAFWKTLCIGCCVQKSCGEKKILCDKGLPFFSGYTRYATL